MSPTAAAPPLLAQLARRGGPLKQLRGWPRIVDAFCPRAGGERYRFDLNFFGMRYRGHLGSVIDRQVFFFGAYEKYELAFVRQWWGKRPGGVALDVGANVGHHALAFSRVFAEVHAFEPNPDPLALLREKVEENVIANIVVHPVGLWDRDAKLAFNTPPADNTGMGSFKEGMVGATVAAPLLLPVRMGDRLLAERGIEHIDLLKIDVQGAEGEVVAGLAQTLARSRPLVWIEISQATQGDFPTLGALIARLGGGTFEAFAPGRIAAWHNGMSMQPMTEAQFGSFDGNLFLVPTES